MNDRNDKMNLMSVRLQHKSEASTVDMITNGSPNEVSVTDKMSAGLSRRHHHHQSATYLSF